MIDDSRVLKPLFIILKYIPVVGSLVSSGLAAFEIAETAVDKPILELFQQNEEKCRRYIRYIQEADVNVIQSQIHTLFAEDLEINLSKAMNPLIIMLTHLSKC